MSKTMRHTDGKISLNNSTAFFSSLQKLMFFMFLSSILVTVAESFTLLQYSSPNLASTTKLNIFGGLKDAFANDESLGKAKNAGLASGPRYNNEVTVNGKAISNVVVDQKISQVCNAARVKVPYNCQNGECGTCTVKINGKKVKACVSKVPTGKCNIQTL